MAAILDTVKPGVKRVVFGAAALAFAVAVVCGVFWWRASEVRARAVPHLPPTPDLNRFGSELQERVAAAEEEVLSGWRPLEGLAQLSRLHHANGFFAEARRAYQGLVALDPENPRWPHLLASIYAGYGQMGEAVPLLRRTVTLAPEYLPAKLRLGDALQKTNAFDEAAAVFRAALSQQPDNAYALLGLAKGGVAAGNWSAARAHLYRIPLDQRRLTGAWALLTTVEEQLGDAAAAAAANAAQEDGQRFRGAPDPWLDELIVESYDVYRIRVQAAVIAATGEIGQARRLLERAMVLAPSDPKVHRDFAQVMEQLGEITVARSHLERAVELDPREADGWNNLIELLKKIGDVQAVDRAVVKGLAHCPDSPTLHLERARRLAATGQFPEALAGFRESQRLRPQEAVVYVEIARVLFKLERVEEGVAELARALVVDPNHPIALGILTRYAIEAGDEAGAKRLLQRIRSQPKMAQDFQLLAREFQAKFNQMP